jgi:hypothetical protein
MDSMILALAAYLSGHWSCTSGSQTYTTDWSTVAGTQWLRGTNRSSAHGVSSQSEDMQTYDAARHLWRIVDMEPDGSMSVLEGESSDSDHIATASVYPDASQRVRYDKVSSDRYTLTFDFVIKGKSQHWVDTCSRV